MAVSLRRALACRAPVPVFVAEGGGGSEAARRLLGRPGLDVVASPRHAAVLLVVGAITPGLRPPLARLHDQLPHPRCTVWWSGSPADALWDTVEGTRPIVTDDPLPALTERYGTLMLGGTTSEPDLLADQPAHVWQGVGPFGQGGEGMMGGTPYGRPMAMTGEDRDGLTLDRLHLTVGPFLPGWPAGLSLGVVLQGELVQEITSIEDLVSPEDGISGAGVDTDDALFWRALFEPVPIADLERARARHHLGLLAGALVLNGLPALAAASARLAATPEPSAREVARVARQIMRSGLCSWIGGGIGVIDGDRAAAVGGPTARAAGVPADLRANDDGYRALSFEPVVGRCSDVAGRWRQRLAEVQQAFALAERADQLGVFKAPGEVEAPEGPRTPAETHRPHLLHQLLPGLLADRDWDELVATIASLDLRVDLAPARASRRPQ